MGPRTVQGEGWLGWGDGVYGFTMVHPQLLVYGYTHHWIIKVHRIPCKCGALKTSPMLIQY